MKILLILAIFGAALAAGLSAPALAQSWSCTGGNPPVSCQPGSPDCTCMQQPLPAPNCTPPSYWNGSACQMPYVPPVVINPYPYYTPPIVNPYVNPNLYIHPWEPHPFRSGIPIR